MQQSQKVSGTKNLKSSWEQLKTWIGKLSSKQPRADKLQLKSQNETEN
jgi:hypothetical protein